MLSEKPAASDCVVAEFAASLNRLVNHFGLEKSTEFEYLSEYISYFKLSLLSLLTCPPRFYRRSLCCSMPGLFVSAAIFAPLLAVVLRAAPPYCSSPLLCSSGSGLSLFSFTLHKAKGFRPLPLLYLIWRYPSKPLPRCSSKLVSSSFGEEEQGETLSCSEDGKVKKRGAKGKK
ncbi:hypothetical protein PIB30_038348 [Stylosanthes scabra]|uniref:Uncharacterized protein n=1 Tax=Stylosanthes scabra TaxID=79078 RepID=A0ABU6YBB3_9FABA|nr:hypothetical protein [Stylosanthes scabra]